MLNERTYHSGKSWMSLSERYNMTNCAGKNSLNLSNELQESLPAWTQKAYRSPRSKYTLRCSGWGYPPILGPHLEGGGTPSQLWIGCTPFPGPDRREGYPLSRSRWGVPPSQVLRTRAVINVYIFQWTRDFDVRVSHTTWEGLTYLPILPLGNQSNENTKCFLSLNSTAYPVVTQTSKCSHCTDWLGWAQIPLEEWSQLDKIHHILPIHNYFLQIHRGIDNSNQTWRLNDMKQL